MPREIICTLVNDKTGVSVQLIKIERGYEIATMLPNETRHYRYLAYVEKSIAIAKVEELAGKKVPE